MNRTGLDASLQAIYENAIRRRLLLLQHVLTMISRTGDDFARGRNYLFFFSVLRKLADIFGDTRIECCPDSPTRRVWLLYSLSPAPVYSLLHFHQYRFLIKPIPLREL